MLFVAPVGAGLEPRNASRHVAEPADHEVQAAVAVQIGHLHVGHTVQVGNDDLRRGCFDAVADQLQGADVGGPLLGRSARFEIADGADVRRAAEELDVDGEYLGGRALARDLDAAVGTEHGQRVQGAVTDVRFAGCRPDMHQGGHGSRHVVVGFRDTETRQFPGKCRLVHLRQRLVRGILDVVEAQRIPLAGRECRLVGQRVLAYQDIAPRGDGSQRHRRARRQDGRGSASPAAGPCSRGRSASSAWGGCRDLAPGDTRSSAGPPAACRSRSDPAVRVSWLPCRAAGGVALMLRTMPRRAVPIRQYAKRPHGVRRQYGTFPSHTAEAPAKHHVDPASHRNPPVSMLRTAPTGREERRARRKRTRRHASDEQAAHSAARQARRGATGSPRGLAGGLGGEAPIYG